MEGEAEEAEAEMEAAAWGGITRKAGERPGTLQGCQKPGFPWKSLLGGMPKLPIWENRV